MPEFYMILVRKIIKIPEFLYLPPQKLTKFPNFTRLLALKIPEFYIIIAGKIFYPIFFWGGARPPAPVSCAYVPDSLPPSIVCPIETWPNRDGGSSLFV